VFRRVPDLPYNCILHMRPTTGTPGMSTLISGGTLLTPTEQVEDGWVLVENDRVAETGCGEGPPADRTIDADGRFIAPGFIDLHVQGIGGCDLWDASEDRFERAMRRLASTGVVACQASVEAGREVCEVMRPRIGRSMSGARVLGLYFEAPFAAPEKRGAIPPEQIREPSPETAEAILDFSRGLVSMVTVAPERPGALDLVHRLRQEPGPSGWPIVCALGHTAARYDDAVAGVRAGITHCTHLFNTMTWMHHREPGPIGAVLIRPHVTAEIICDGVHLHPATVRLTVLAKGTSRTCLVTDGVSGREHPVVDGAPRLPDGTLAGSTLTMDRAVANVMRFADLALPEAVEMATLTPARVLGLEEARGSLAAAKAADIILFDDDVRVSLTMIAGRVLWEAEDRVV